MQLLIWNEMNSDADIAAHLSLAPKGNDQENLPGFVDFFSSVWWITVDMLVISAVERYFRLFEVHSEYTVQGVSQLLKQSGSF